VNVLSSILNSADVYKSSRIVVRMSLAIATMYVLSTYVSDRGRVVGALKALLVAGAAASAFGIVAAVVWHCFGQDFGVQRDPVTGAMSVKGTLWEGNIFGSYVAGIATLSGGLIVSRARTFDRRFLSIVFALSAAALVLSLTRGAWLGFAVGAISMILLLRGARLPVALLLVGLTVVTTALVLRFDLGGTSENVTSRFASLSAMQADPTAISRLKIVDQALAEWRQSPLLGWGTDGYHVNHPKVLSHLPTPELNALYDTGLIGLTLFATIVGAILFRAAMAANRRLDEGLTTLLGAVTVAAIAQFVAFQATDAFWLGFIWVYLGLMLATTRLINEGAPKINAEPR
jgi:O-antigen ligase